jgi:hypothetical protein
MTTHTTPGPYVRATGGCGVIVAAVVSLSACGLGAGRAAKGHPRQACDQFISRRPPSYFLGRSFAGIDLTADAAGYDGSLTGEGVYFEYGTCEYAPDSRCSTQIQVHNNTEI